MRIQALVVTVLLVIGVFSFKMVVAGNAPATVHAQNGRLTAEFFFPNEKHALANGKNVLLLIKSPSKSNSVKLRNYIGKKIALFGGAARPGGSADLEMEAGIKVKVNIVPHRDVRPKAHGWDAAVLGMLTKVDEKHKILYVTARPQDWKVGDTV